MKYKNGDKVRVKSIEWYDKNKEADGSVNLVDTNDGDYNFVEPMSRYCGRIVTICGVDYVDRFYDIVEDEGEYYWTDEMFEDVMENKDKQTLEQDNVNHPKWYTQHPSGVECIDITRHYCFSIGNAIKYLWRAGLKKEQGLEDIEKEVEDLNKAIWYIKDRIKQITNVSKT